MKEKQYTFSVLSEEENKVYSISAKKFKLALLSVALIIVSLVVTCGYMGYSFYQFNSERSDFLQFKAQKADLEARLQSLTDDNEKMLRDMAEITTLETKLRRALIRDTDSSKFTSVAPGELKETSATDPYYLGKGGAGRTSSLAAASILEAQNKNIQYFIDEKKMAMSELLSEMEGRNNKRSTFPDLWPTNGGEISSFYGGRTEPIEGGYDWHSGVDIAADFATPVYASAMGVVEIAGWNGGYGRYVRINHSNGYVTAYGHMSGIAVAVGQSVRKGEIIGFVGSSGYSTGTHVHFEVFVDGYNMDPLYMLKVGQKLNK